MSYQQALQLYPYWLPQVEEALRLEGFGGGPQIVESGQRSGWIKALEGGYQLHVRLFNDGTIRPHQELDWKLVEHPGTSSPAIDIAMAILDKYGILYHIVYTEPYTANGHIPASRTPWIGVLALILLGVLMIKAAASR